METRDWGAVEAKPFALGDALAAQQEKEQGDQKGMLMKALMMGAGVPAPAAMPVGGSSGAMPKLRQTPMP